jgi:hypothetical protein
MNKINTEMYQRIVFFSRILSIFIVFLFSRIQTFATQLEHWVAEFAPLATDSFVVRPDCSWSYSRDQLKPSPFIKMNIFFKLWRPYRIYKKMNVGWQCNRFLLLQIETDQKILDWKTWNVSLKSTALRSVMRIEELNNKKRKFKTRRFWINFSNWTKNVLLKNTFWGNTSERCRQRWKTTFLCSVKRERGSERNLHVW